MSGRGPVGYRRFFSLTLESQQCDIEEPRRGLWTSSFNKYKSCFFEESYKDLLGEIFAGPRRDPLSGYKLERENPGKDTKDPPNDSRPELFSASTFPS